MFAESPRRWPLGLDLRVRDELAIRGQGLASADPLRLRQILRNLTNNALTHHRTVAEIVIRTDGDRLRIEVIDDGPGIDPAVAHQVFNTDASTVDSASETLAIGVGLSLSRRFANAMGAALTYRRLDGQTVLSLDLPVAVRSVGSDDVDEQEVTTADVVRAIEHQPPTIALQPIFDLATFYKGEPDLVGVEALSRFPKGGPAGLVRRCGGSRYQDRPRTGHDQGGGPADHRPGGYRLLRRP